MDPVQAQYESFPYPERDPGEETRRLIEGSPSHPVEIDHFIFGGRRDWSRPFRALVAGGGTGDGLVMLAQKLADIGCPAEITYLDMSAASRKVAEARIAARGLASVRFLTGDLLEAPGHGPFDYIDCCGVLHHLPDPDAGFAALAAALSPEGGMGLMVYAPWGRTGVYPLQEAFGALFDGMAPAARIGPARAALAALPETNWFPKNPHLSDHRNGDAGLYDLLLHARDRPYRVADVVSALDRARLALAGFVEPARYDPTQYLPPALHPLAARLDPVSAAGVAEALAGNMRLHTFYAVPAARGATEAKPTRADAIPVLSGVSAPALARQIAQAGGFTATTDGLPFRVAIPRSAGALVARLGAGRSLGEIAAAVKLDWMEFQAAWAPVHRGLTGLNLMHYSQGARR